MKKIEPRDLSEIDKQDLYMIKDIAHKEYINNCVGHVGEDLFTAKCYYSAMLTYLQKKGYKLVLESDSSVDQS